MLSEEVGLSARDNQTIPFRYFKTSRSIRDAQGLFWGPHSVSHDQGVSGFKKLSNDGDDGDLQGFSGGAKRGEFRLEIGVEPHGGQGRHVECFAQGSASSTDDSSAFPRSGFSVVRSEACKASRLFSSRLGQSLSQTGLNSADTGAFATSSICLRGTTSNPENNGSGQVHASRWSDLERSKASSLDLGMGGILCRNKILPPGDHGKYRAAGGPNAGPY